MVPNSSMLSGKSILIVGSSRGIGESIVRICHAHGAQVMLASRDVGANEKIAAELDASGKTARATFADLTNAGSLESAVSETVAAFGKIDAAVNNGAVQIPRSPLVDISDEDFDYVVNINLRGVFLAMRAQIRAMLAGGGGSIVNIASTLGLIGRPEMSPYCASKHGVVGLTRAAAVEYGPEKIRVNAIAPGGVLTDMVKNTPGASPEGLLRMTAAVPMRRMAEPEEIAGAVVWLCSDASPYATGVILPVDGGTYAM